MSDRIYAGALHLTLAECAALKLTDAYSLHRVVYGLFEDTRTEEDKKASAQSGFQYADMGSTAEGRSILLLSNRKPSLKTQSGHGRVVIKEIPDHFLSADTYHFEVTVNPVRRNGQTRKLVPVKGAAEIAQWFAERAVSSWGFEVDGQSLQVGTVNVVRFQSKEQQEVTLAQVKVAGVLTVKDREQFKTSFSTGIGKGRAFGCGLLKIVPIQK